MTIYVADPPWRYNFSKSKSREVENQYPTMTPAEIQGIDYEFDDDSVLYLWATAPKLREALAVMDAWGFEYKSNIVWDKIFMGMGYWSRGRHEHVLIGVKGKHSPPPPHERRSSVFGVKRDRKHSAKPEYLQQCIDAWFPAERKVELFARRHRSGWESIGDELGSPLETKEAQDGQDPGGAEGEGKPVPRATVAGDLEPEQSRTEPSARPRAGTTDDEWGVAR